jgi:ABC-type glutathione transport system ATPase component
MEVRLSAAYGKQRVLTNVEFDLCAGEALGMVGASGAGKTTLVMALLGLLPWRGGKARGHVMVGGVDLLATNSRHARTLRGKTIALIPQSPMTALNAMVSLRAHFDAAWGAHESSGRKGLEPRLRLLLEEVQLPARDQSFLARKPGQISVGQAQRVLLALALLHRPSILIADEPTSALDAVTQAEVVRLLHKLTRNQETALLYISHDLISVLALCDRLAVLYGGTIAETVPIAQIGQAKHPATLSLLRSLPLPAEVLLSHLRAGGWEDDRNAGGADTAPGAVPEEIQTSAQAQLSYFKTGTTEDLVKTNLHNMKDLQSPTVGLCSNRLFLRKPDCTAAPTLEMSNPMAQKERWDHET